MPSLMPVVVMVNGCWRSCLQSVYDVFTMWPPVPGRVYQAWAGTLCPEKIALKKGGSRAESAQRWMVSI